MLIYCLYAKLWTIICSLPSRHLIVQCQQMKHQNNVWSQFLANDKDIRSTSVTFFWCFQSLRCSGNRVYLSVWSPFPDCKRIIRQVCYMYYVWLCILHCVKEQLFCKIVTNTMISLYVSNFRISVSGFRNRNKNKRKISYKLQYYCIYWIQRHSWFCYTNEQFIESK